MSNDREASSEQLDDAVSQEEERFIEGLIMRGEAAEPAVDDTLPDEATHEIVAGDDGERVVRRRHFSIE